MPRGTVGGRTRRVEVGVGVGVGVEVEVVLTGRVAFGRGEG